MVFIRRPRRYGERCTIDVLYSHEQAKEEERWVANCSRTSRPTSAVVSQGPPLLLRAKSEIFLHKVEEDIEDEDEEGEEVEEGEKDEKVEEDDEWTWRTMRSRRGVEDAERRIRRTRRTSRELERGGRAGNEQGTSRDAPR